MTDMTKGIKVLWREGPPGRQIGEIEYFYGIDVNRLDDIPKFTKVRASRPMNPRDDRDYPNWPRWIEYVVSACTRNHSTENEVYLTVTYEEANNPKIVSLYEEFRIDRTVRDGLWGENSIVLTKGGQSGRFKWQGDDGDKVKGEWEAFDLGAACARPSRSYRGSVREDKFRAIILGYDDNRCVLTGETTTQALDAAHLIPAKKGQNDEPFNGITLRADLHRLFDAGQFTLDGKGKVVLNDDARLSEEYRDRLSRACGLPKETLKRVRATLAHPQFQNRPPAR